MTELEELRLAYAECSRQRNELLAKLKGAQQAEPVGYLYVSDPWGAPEYNFSLEKQNEYSQPLYTSPPKREWQGLTDEEKNALVDAFYGTDIDRLEAVEAKLKERNT